MTRWLWIAALAFGLAVAAFAADKPAGLGRGTVVALDLVSRQLTLDTPEGRQTLGFPAKTFVFRDKEKLPHDKLKPGDDIRFSWYRDDAGKVQINRIKFALPPEPAP